MYSYEIQKNDGLIVLTSVGKTTYDDYQSIAPKFYADVRMHKINKILIDSRQFTGWDSKKAESLAFDSWMQGRSMFDRVALVVLDAFDNDIKRFFDLFHDAGKDIRVFSPSEYESALDWLKEDGRSEDAPAHS